MSRTVPAGTPLGDDFHVYDTTLRDGAQREGITLLGRRQARRRPPARRARGRLHRGRLAGGDAQGHRVLRPRRGTELTLRHAALVAFGATRKAGATADDDPQVRALLDAQAPVVTLVAKSDLRHVERALRTDVAENLAMVPDTVAFLRAEGRRVFLDGEHFFDGYRFDPDTALRVLEAAVAAGADVAVLCDTNGGMLPLGIAEVVTRGHGPHRVPARHPLPGRHRLRGRQHRRRGRGGRDARPVHRQRLRRAARQRRPVRRRREPRDQARHARPTGRRLAELTRTSHAFAEIANIAPDTHQAYVGAAAFAHKAGLHASAIKVDPELYNHMDPWTSATTCGSWSPRWPAGPASSSRAASSAWTWPAVPTPCRAWSPRSRSWRRRGWSFEAADASFELLVRSALGDDAGAVLPFALESYRVIIEHRDDGEVVCEATVKIGVDGERVIATREGNGPVNALDDALRAALAPSRPWLADVELSDYKVRILEGAGDARHGRGHPGARRVDRRRGLVDDGRRARQRRRGVLVGAGRRPGVRGTADGPARRRALTGPPVAHR